MWEIRQKLFRKALPILQKSYLETSSLCDLFGSIVSNLFSVLFLGQICEDYLKLLAVIPRRSSRVHQRIRPFWRMQIALGVEETTSRNLCSLCLKASSFRFLSVISVITPTIPRALP